MVENCKTVLLVDDEEIVLDVGVLMLKRLGFQVLQAREGTEALEVYKQNPENVDLVIMDLVMPNGGGLTLYRQLRSLNPHVKVIATSGYDSSGQMDELSELGCSNFIQKPFILSQLSEKINEVLN
jgi:two-component system, cell cycle sensor histidine kinase and response regulator CckA